MSDENNDALGEAILTENFSDILARAEAGDVLAARDALITLAGLLSTSNKHPKTGALLPVPEYVRDYLSRSLYQLARQNIYDDKIDANKALHLTKSGPKKWGHFEKRLAADLVFRLVEKGFPVADSLNGEDATTKASEIISVHASADKCPPAWRAFKNTTIDPSTLKAWFFEHKAELEEIRKKLQL